MIRVNMRDLEEELIAVFMSINKGMTMMSVGFNESDSTNIRKWYWHWSILMLEYSKNIYIYFTSILFVFVVVICICLSNEINIWMTDDNDVISILISFFESRKYAPSMLDFVNNFIEIRIFNFYFKLYHIKNYNNSVLIFSYFIYFHYFIHIHF